MTGLLIMSKSSIVCFAQDAVAPLVEVNKTYLKAVNLYEHKKWNAAKEAFHEFLSISDANPLVFPAMYYLAYCYQQLHDDAKSSTLYQKVINEAGSQDVFWSQMAQKRLEELSPKVSSLN